MDKSKKQQISDGEKKVGRKKSAAPHSFLLVYPNSFYLGMSNLGYQSVISLVDGRPEWYAERTFAGFERSLEEKRTFSSFDVVAFSIVYEMDYAALPAIFQAGRIPLRADRRNDRHPLIMAGGMAPTINPEPIADFMDLIVLGEAEAVLPAVLEEMTAGGALPREELLRRLAELRGVYVPRFYRSRFDKAGRLLEIVGEGGASLPVRREKPVDPDLRPAASIYLNRRTAFSNRALLEIGRGCRRRCRFCVTGGICGPERNRSPESIYQTADRFRGLTRFLGLISPAGSDHPEIGAIAGRLVKDGFSISISSLRADSVTPTLLSALADGGQRTITLAPETGLPALRKRLNKGLADEVIAAALASARRAGIERAKLYFLIGLPEETREDIDGIVEFARRLSSLLPLTISISPFIPKPHTPFQWCGFDRPDSLKKKTRYLKSELGKVRRVRVSAAGVRSAVRQASLSRGDRRMARAIEEGSWTTAEDLGEPFRTREKSEFLPWSIFDYGITAEGLWKEYQDYLLG